MFPFRFVHLNIASTQLQVMPPVLLDAIWTKTNNVSSQTHVIYIKNEHCKVYYQFKNPESLFYMLVWWQTKLLLSLYSVRWWFNPVIQWEDGVDKQTRQWLGLQHSICHSKSPAEQC